MNTRTIKPLLAALAAALAVVSTARAETLGDMLRDSGWNRIVGTWLDEGSKGEAIKVTYKWRFKDRVLDVTTRTPDMESAGLVAVSGESREVVHVAADNRGGTAIGKWSEEDGDAVLEMAYVTADGEEGGMRVVHHLKDDDTMVVTIQGEGDPMTITMVRAK